MRKLFGRQNIPRKPPAQAATIAAKQTASFAFEQPNEDNDWQDLTQPQQQGQQQIVRELREREQLEDETSERSVLFFFSLSHALLSQIFILK